MRSQDVREEKATKGSDIKRVGLRLREVRLELNYSQQHFASCLNTSTGFISEIESGKKLPGVHLLHSLWRKFNIDTNWLITGRGTMFNSNSKPPRPQSEWGINPETDASIQQQVAKLVEENEQLRQKVQQLESQVSLLSDLIIRIKKET